MPNLAECIWCDFEMDGDKIDEHDAFCPNCNEGFNYHEEFEVMTKAQVVASFESFAFSDDLLLSEARQGFRDVPARSERWNNYVDSLNKDGFVTGWQAYNWTHPTTCD